MVQEEGSVRRDLKMRGRAGGTGGWRRGEERKATTLWCAVVPMVCGCGPVQLSKDVGGLCVAARELYVRLCFPHHRLHFRLQPTIIVSKGGDIRVWTVCEPSNCDCDVL
jgi:hypothetical protein